VAQQPGRDPVFSPSVGRGRPMAFALGIAFRRIFAVRVRRRRCVGNSQADAPRLFFPRIFDAPPLYQVESLLVSYGHCESRKERVMATNMAQKRAKKAQRRKQVVAQKRRADAIEASLPARVLRAAEAPIQHCFLTDSVFEIGMGTLVLARGATSHYLAFSVFLIDTFCLGIKDVMFDSIESEAFERYMAVADAGSAMVSVDPAYARKLLRDLAAWSQSIGFAPHRDFAAVERLFGDVSADASDEVFQFGRDGKPVYIPGPSETAPQMRRRIEQLQKYLGDDGFETAA
jgi:hypothetical protein